MRTQTIRLPRHDLYASRGKPASPYGVNADGDARNSNPVAQDRWEPLTTLIRAGS